MRSLITSLLFLSSTLILTHSTNSLAQVPCLAQRDAVLTSEQELAKSKNNLEQAIARLQNSTANLILLRDREIGKLDKKITSLESNKDKLEKSLDPISSACSKNKRSKDCRKSKTLKKKISSESKKISKEKSSRAKKLVEHNTRIDREKQRVAETQAQLANLNNAVTTAQSGLDSCYSIFGRPYSGLRIFSGQKDVVGQGQNLTFLDTNLDRNSVRVTANNLVQIRFNHEILNLDISFAAKAGTELAIGGYVNATHQKTDKAPYLYISSNKGRCNEVAGSFQVQDLAYYPDGRLARLALNFSQTCDESGTPLFGSLRYDTNLPFVDLTQSRFPANFAVYGTALDPITQGVSSNYNENDSDFGVNFLDKGSKVVSNIYKDGKLAWKLSFYSGNAEALTVGQTYLVNGSSGPSMRVESASGAPSDCKLIGAFKVQDASYVGVGKVLIDFYQACAKPSIIGELKFPAISGRLNFNSVKSVEAKDLLVVPTSKLSIQGSAIAPQGYDEGHGVFKAYNTINIVNNKQVNSITTEFIKSLSENLGIRFARSDGKAIASDILNKPQVGEVEIYQSGLVCGGLTGNFTIIDLATSGTNITSFAATFSKTCSGGGTITGKISVNSSK